MALTAQEKADSVFYLGYSEKTIISGSADYSSTMYNYITNLSAASEVRVRALLVRLAALEANLTDACSRLSAKKVGEIELRDDELYQLKKERRRITLQLSDHLTIPAIGSGFGSITVIV